MDPLSLTVTVATESDSQSIARLCRRTVGRSDYALGLLPFLIERGTLFLAWNEGMLAGITHFDKCIDGSGWLSVARTDPIVQGRGVARFLQRKIAAHARQQGIPKLRMWVLAQNKPSIRATTRGGFVQVCETAHVYSTLRNSKPKRKVAPRSVSDIQVDALLKSSYLTKTGGYIGYRRQFIELTKDVLARLCDDHEFYCDAEQTVVISRPEMFFGTLQSSLSVLRGTLVESLIRAKYIARGMGARRLSSYIPYGQYEISNAKRAGFRRSSWGRHCLVFEKTLT